MNILAHRLLSRRPYCVKFNIFCVIRNHSTVATKMERPAVQRSRNKLFMVLTEARDSFAELFHEDTLNALAHTSSEGHLWAQTFTKTLTLSGQEGLAFLCKHTRPILQHIYLKGEGFQVEQYHADHIATTSSALQTFSVQGGYVTAAAIKQLGRFANLHALVFSSCPLSDKAAEHLSKAHFGQLTALQLSNMGLSVCALKAILAAPYAASLRSLDIGDNLLQTSHFRLLSRATLPKLKALTVDGAKLHAESVQELVKGNWKSLTSISAKRSHSKLKAKTLRHLPSIDCPRLKSLMLSGNTLSTAAVEALKQGNWCRLSILDMSACGLSGEVIKCLVSATWPMKELNLSCNRLDNYAITSLAFSQWRLSKLFLRNTGIDLRCLLVRFEAYFMVGLEVLDVSGNHLAQPLCSHVGRERVHQIAQLFHNTGQGNLQDGNKWVNFAQRYIQDCVCGSQAKVITSD